MAQPDRSAATPPAAAAGIPASQAGRHGHRGLVHTLGGTRRRLSVAGHMAYSRLATVTKIGLVAAAGALVVLLALNSGQDAPATAVADSTAEGKLEMAAPRLMGADSKGQPFSLRADKAVQDPADPNIFTLTRPQAEITTLSGNWVTLTADAGRYDQTARKLALSGHVTLHHDDGHEFVTEEAFADFATRFAWGNKPVDGQGPFGVLHGGGFRLHDNGSTIVLTGRPHMTLAEGMTAGKANAAGPTTQ